MGDHWVPWANSWLTMITTNPKHGDHGKWKGYHDRPWSAEIETWLINTNHGRLLPTMVTMVNLDNNMVNHGQTCQILTREWLDTFRTWFAMIELVDHGQILTRPCLTMGYPEYYSSEYYEVMVSNEKFYEDHCQPWYFCNFTMDDYHGLDH